ncbi:MAG TPA: PASTA domain-containing protein, partial [Acidimicrobiales bacterium]
SQGPTVAFTVAAAAPKKKFPWWIVAAAAAAVLVIAVVAFFLTRDDDEPEVADPVTMPDLIGLPQSQAVSQLQALGVTVASISPVDPAVVPGPDDCIALQAPFPGQPATDEGAALATAPCPAPGTPTVTFDPGISICDIQPVICDFAATDLTIPVEVLEDQFDEQFDDFSGP